MRLLALALALTTATAGANECVDRIVYQHEIKRPPYLMAPGKKTMTNYEIRRAIRADYQEIVDAVKDSARLTGYLAEAYADAAKLYPHLGSITKAEFAKFRVIDSFRHPTRIDNSIDAVLCSRVELYTSAIRLILARHSCSTMPKLKRTENIQYRRDLRQ